MDAAASAEQAEALGALFGGQRGGPMAGIAPLAAGRAGSSAVNVFGMNWDNAGKSSFSAPFAWSA
ncbi:DUF1326 domain-containing protein [Arthrobacter sp. GCM10027362]|uniref:DUF1326 domain-containing protein n=1 Tax=Arthrobacter sp. GCM10027362 TaxID=3273379 RepID=UPI0036318717